MFNQFERNSSNLTIFSCYRGILLFSNINNDILKRSPNSTMRPHLYTQFVRLLGRVFADGDLYFVGIVCSSIDTFFLLNASSSFKKAMSYWSIFSQNMELRNGILVLSFKWKHLFNNSGLSRHLLHLRLVENIFFYPSRFCIEGTLEASLR